MRYRDESYEEREDRLSGEADAYIKREKEEKAAALLPPLQPQQPQPQGTTA
jgi:hypothetical protein